MADDSGNSLKSAQPKPLTRKQRAFCREYVKDWNGTQAAIRAGYSPDTANEQAAQLLAKLSIRQEVDATIAKLMDDEKAEIKSRVVEELRKIGFNDAERDEVYNKEGELVAVSRRDRIKALELLGKYGALFTEKVMLGGSLDLAVAPDLSKLTPAEQEALFRVMERL